MVTVLTFVRSFVRSRSLSLFVVICSLSPFAIFVCLLSLFAIFVCFVVIVRLLSVFVRCCCSLPSFAIFVRSLSSFVAVRCHCSLSSFAIFVRCCHCSFVCCRCSFVVIVRLFVVIVHSSSMLPSPSFLPSSSLSVIARCHGLFLRSLMSGGRSMGCVCALVRRCCLLVGGKLLACVAVS